MNSSFDCLAFLSQLNNQFNLRMKKSYKIPLSYFKLWLVLHGWNSLKIVEGNVILTIAEFMLNCITNLCVYCVTAFGK